jgi:hypothetical protein
LKNYPMPDFREVRAPGSRGATVLEFTCVICETRFRRYASQVRGGAEHGHGKYCSPHCRGIARGRAAADRLSKEDKRREKNPNWRGMTNPRICPVCETSFVPKSGNQVCCTAACGQERRRPKMRREGNGSWISQERYLALHYRELIDTSACSVCGETERVHAHHIDGDRSHNVVENLDALCHWCHVAIHAIRNLKKREHLATLMPYVERLTCLS